jgi:hypothetical protein
VYVTPGENWIELLETTTPPEPPPPPAFLLVAAPAPPPPPTTTANTLDTGAAEETITEATLLEADEQDPLVTRALKYVVALRLAVV